LKQKRSENDHLVRVGRLWASILNCAEFRYILFFGIIDPNHVRFALEGIEFIETAEHIPDDPEMLAGLYDHPASLPVNPPLIDSDDLPQ
jgi:hypothetical protein